jgi:hypothetical protein
MRFTGMTVLRIENGTIAEEIGLDDGVTALQQLGLAGVAILLDLAASWISNVHGAHPNGRHWQLASERVWPAGSALKD